MSINNFIPEVWSTTLLRQLHKKLVFAQPAVCNRNYEGDIKDKGDVVRISAIGPINTYNYQKNTDIQSPDALTDEQTTLPISQAKYFNFSVSDLDKVQQQPKVMEEAMGEAAYSIMNQEDQYVAGLYTDVSVNNKLGTDGAPKTLTLVTDLYPLIVGLKVALDQANVDTDARWCIVPPWCEGVLLQDDRFVRQYDASVALGALQNGRIAKAAGFDIYLSNNVTYTGTQATGNYRIMAGYPGAITFAEQLVKTEAYRPPNRFDDAVKGLAVYGARVVRPSGLALLTLTRNLA